MGYIEALEPGEQLFLEVGHSAGQVNHEADAFHANHESVEYGGERKMPRDFVMNEVCLGPRDARIYPSPGGWSTIFIHGRRYDAAREHEARLGQAQHMPLAPGDSPPSAISRPCLRISRGIEASRTDGTGGSGLRGRHLGVPREEARSNTGEASCGCFVAGILTGEKAPPEPNLKRVPGEQTDTKDERRATRHLEESRGYILLPFAPAADGGRGIGDRIVLGCVWRR